MIGNLVQGSFNLDDFSNTLQEIVRYRDYFTKNKDRVKLTFIFRCVASPTIKKIKEELAQRYKLQVNEFIHLIDGRTYIIFDMTRDSHLAKYRHYMSEQILKVNIVGHNKRRDIEIAFNKADFLKGNYLYIGDNIPLKDICIIKI